MCVGNVSCLDSNLTANLTHVSMNPPVQKSFLGVRSQGSTHATLLSGTSTRGTNTLRTRKNSAVRWCKTQEEISNLQKITCPNLLRTIPKKDWPVLPRWREMYARSLCISGSFVCTQIPSLSNSPWIRITQKTPIIVYQLLDQCDRLWRDLRLSRISLWRVLPE